MFNFLNGNKTYIGAATVLAGIALFIYATLVGDLETVDFAVYLIGTGFGVVFIGIGHKGQKILYAILDLAALLKKLADQQPPEEPTGQ